MAITMRTNFGYKRDPSGHRYTGFHRHPAYGAALVDAASIDDLAPPIWNQRRTATCVGHGTAGGITTTYAAKGIPLPSPVAARSLYGLAKSIDRKRINGKLPPLVDDGCEPNEMVRAIAEWGVPLESEVDDGRGATSPDYEDYLEAHVTDEPALDELLAGDERLLVGFNAILSEADEKVREICQSIADRYAVMAGVCAGNAAFQGFRDGLLDYTGDRPDHWVYFTAFRTNAGRKEIKMRNSWGLADWTRDGGAWCSEDFIRRGMFGTLVANLGL
jgi:hypothetical protein